MDGDADQGSTMPVTNTPSRSSILPPGTPAPDFSLSSGPNKKLTLSDLRGKPVIVVFYNEILDEFTRYGAQLLGISVDGTWCHAAFAKQRNLRFPLLSDFEPKG